MKKHFIYFMILNILFIFTILHGFHSVLVSNVTSIESKCYLIGLLNVRFLFFQFLFTIWYIPSTLLSTFFACIYGYLLINSDFDKEFTIEVLKQTYLFLCMGLIFFYFLERSFKISFLQQKKIEGLI